MTAPTDKQPSGKAGSAQRVRDYLDAHGLLGDLHTFEQSTKTAQDAADAMGCALGQIVKSLVFSAGDSAVLALVAGDRRGDAKAIASEVGASKARLADAETVRSATGYAIGGVSPFDLSPEVTVLVDDSLERFEIVYPAAGTPSSMVRMSRADLLRLSGGTMACISHEVGA